MFEADKVMYGMSNTNGEWSSVSSTLDHTTTEQEVYHRLATLGFRDYQELVYRGGNARLYIRENIPGKPSAPLAYGFCCLLYLGHFLYVVGLKSLQDIPHFLREIDAHPKEASIVTIANLPSFQQNLSQSLAALATSLEEPRVIVEDLSGMKTTLDRLITTLTALGKSLSETATNAPSALAGQKTQNRKSGTAALRRRNNHAS